MTKHIKRLLLLSLGWISIILGFIGIFLPILPTTPFLLLASWAFYKSSDKFYHWLMNHKLLGSYITNLKTKKGIPLRAKVITIILLNLSIFSTIYFHDFSYLLECILAIIAIVVTIYLTRLKTISN